MGSWSGWMAISCHDHLCLRKSSKSISGNWEEGMVCPRLLYYKAKRVLIILLCILACWHFAFKQPKVLQYNNREFRICIPTSSTLFHRFCAIAISASACATMQSTSLFFFIDGRFAHTLAVAFWAEHWKSEWSIESVVPPRLVFGHWMSTTLSSWMQYIHGPGPRLNDQKTLCPGQKLLVHMRASFWKELETRDQEMKWMSLNSGSTLSLASLLGETWPSARHDSSCVSKIKEFASTSMNQQSSKRNLTLIFCRPPTSLESHPKSSKGPIQPIQHSNHQWTTFYDFFMIFEMICII